MAGKAKLSVSQHNVLFSRGALCFVSLCLSLLVCMYTSGFSVYSGHQSILVPPLELESNASLWLTAVSQYKVRVTFCSYSVMEMCTKGLGSQTEALRVSLSLRILSFATEKKISCSIFFSFLPQSCTNRGSPFLYLCDHCFQNIKCF